MITILLVEDNKDIATGLAFTMENAGYRLTNARTIEEAIGLVNAGSYSLVLLDVTLPDGDGFSFYENNLHDKNIPTIFLTAKDEENDIVRGLTAGAEDYVTKPFLIKELMVRISKVLSRNISDEVIRSKDISCDMKKHEIYKEGNQITLSSLELKILMLLFENHDKVVSRNAVIDLIYYATGNDVYDHTVTVYIKRIREKLGTDIIKTIKGVGYRIDTE